MWSRVYDLVIAAGFVVRIQYQIQKLDSRAQTYYTSQQLNNKNKVCRNKVKPVYFCYNNDITLQSLLGL